VPLPSQDDIRAAAERIAPHVRHTPVLPLAAGDLVPGHPVVLKLEQLQHTASFKARGAFNGMLSMDMPKAGAIAASGGNHGAAVAYAARALGYPAEIFVPSIIAPAKKARLEDYGAVVNVVGREFAEALEACRARQAETGAVLLHAYDQPEILAGQGTVGLEFEAQAPELDTVLVAVGGGGLIGGIASWYRGRTKLVAVEAEGTATLHSARASGAPVDIAVSGLTADSLGARRIGDLPFEAATRFVADSVLVREDAIRATQRRLWDKLRLITEPGGATALAALLCGAYAPAPDEKVGVLICGGNAAPSSFLGDDA
jgi:threonine dehydratase